VIAYFAARHATAAANNDVLAKKIPGSKPATYVAGF
jgi:hypothetical protein